LKPRLYVEKLATKRLIHGMVSFRDMPPYFWREFLRILKTILLKYLIQFCPLTDIMATDILKPDRNCTFSVSKNILQK
jgi:hypothetical protein